MHSKWKNIFFGLVVIILIVAIVQQGNMLITNMKTTTAFQNNEETEDEEIIKEQKDKGEDEKSAFNNDFLKIMMKKAIPMMELGYKNSGEENNNLFLSLFSMTTKINMKDPKTLLSSQIPMLEKYEPDDVEITVEEQKAFHNLTQKPMNDEKIQVSSSNSSRGKVDSKDPLVLIYHTHATESYTSTSKTKIDYVSPWRTLDKSKNMTRIGEEIKNILEQQYGIKVIHDTTLHDYPDYNVSYTRSLKTVEKILKENPTIKYVFDIHRDGLADNQKNRESYVTVFGGQQTARMMMVVGNDNFNAKQNKQFAQKIQNKLNQKYPGITKSLLARDNRKYNQFVSDYASLIEVGSNLNTLEEALETAKPIGDVLGEIITQQEQ